MPQPMSPRRRVLTALEHKQPDRVPFSWGFGPTGEAAAAIEKYLAGQGLSWPLLRQVTDDIIQVMPAFTGPERTDGRDIWGIGHKAVSYGAGSYNEAVERPLAGMTEVDELDDYPWPDPEAYDYAAVRAALLEKDPDRIRAVKFPAGNPLEIYCWMTGMEEALINLLAAPELAEAALGRITDYFVRRLELYSEHCGDLVDIFFFADDLGSQTGLLLSRPMYRSLVQPCHRRMVEAARRCVPGARMMLHSDGAVFEILPDVMDAGIEILEAVQTDAAGMDPAALKKTYGERLSFHGAISVQQLLPHGDAASVEAECRRLLAVLGAGGGYIAAPSHAIQAGTPPENVLAMLRGVLGEDYAAALAAAAL